MTKEREKGTVSVVYEPGDGRRTIPVNGAFGGITPDGNAVIAHLYLEYASVPDAEQYVVDLLDEPEGAMRIAATQPERAASSDLTREVQTSVLMTAEAAVRIGQWLVKRGQDVMAKRPTGVGSNGETSDDG